MILLIKYCT